MHVFSHLRLIATPALVLAAVAVPAQVAAAGDAPAGRSAVPSDFVTLTDDTGALTIAVPATWADIDTAPGTNDDGSVMPWISAATDYEAWSQTFDVPGVVFIGVTYTEDLQSWLDRLAQADACGSSSTEDYDDGAFVGLATTWRECGTSGQATFMVLAANVEGDTTRSYLLELQAPTAADVALFEPVLAGFHAVGITVPLGEETAASTSPPAATSPAAAPAVTPITLPDGAPLVPATAPGQVAAAPTSAVIAPTAVPTTVSPAAPTTAPTASAPTAPAAPSAPTAPGAVTTTVPASATGPFTPSNSIAVGALQVTDDSRTVTLAVPPDWLDTATAASVDGLPQILAGPQLAAFAPGGVPGQSFAAPGVRFTARPYSPDTADAVSAAAAALPCTAGAVQPYQDPVFTGHIVELTNCGGTASRVFLVEANPADATLTASLLIQVTDPDDSDLQTILSSFDMARTDAAG